MRRRQVSWWTALAVGALLAAPAFAQEVSFSDPTGDDNGPGTYSYPTDAVYKAGSFDITSFKMKAKGDKADFEVGTNSTIEDPWSMKTGFSVQMIFIFIDTDGQAGSGSTAGLPGLNIGFAPDSAWDKVVILSPQQVGRVKNEVQTKAGAMAGNVVIPLRTRGAGRSITATVNLKDLGEGDPTKWGYQVVMQSNEGFPDKADLLTRKVNEYEGQHRFGGGNDGECDPHAIDVLGDNKAQLAYECGADGSSVKMATLTMQRMQ